MLNTATTGHNSFSVNGQAAFLRRLTQDEQFRTELVADPQAVLAGYGLQIDASELPEAVTLPKQEAFSDLLDKIEGEAKLPVIRWMGLFGD